MMSNSKNWPKLKKKFFGQLELKAGGAVDLAGDVDREISDRIYRNSFLRSFSLSSLVQNRQHVTRPIKRQSLPFFAPLRNTFVQGFLNR